MRILNSKKNLYRTAGLITGISCIAMVVFPKIAMDSAQKGVSLWASSVLPALLPFFICANFMTKLGLPGVIGRAFEKPFRAIFGAPGVSAFIFTISITSGYPMGAKIIGDLGRAGQITKAEIKQMLTFCTTSGPLFMLGAVGAGMLHSPAAGIVITVAHYLGAVINGLFYRGFNFFKTNKYAFQRDLNNDKDKLPASGHGHLPSHGGILDMFTDSILSSLKSLGIICGYIVLFTMTTDFIVYSGALNGFSQPIVSIIKGIFEMTVGCSSIAESTDLSLTIICAISSFLISFGGISILAQSMSMLAGLGVSTFYYVKVKLTHGLISFAIAILIGPYLLEQEFLETGITLGPISGNTQVLAANFGFMGGLDGIYCLFFSTKMVIMVVIIMLAMIAIESQVEGKINENSRNNS